jgi:hypothetical protein
MKTALGNQTLTPEASQKLAGGRSAAQTPGWPCYVKTTLEGSQLRGCNERGLLTPLQGAKNIRHFRGYRLLRGAQPPANICQPSGLEFVRTGGNL